MKADQSGVVTAAAAEKRREILRAAATLFDELGYHSTSMIQIAGAVGLQKPTLYHYFKTKNEILYWIHDDFLDVLTALHEKRLEGGIGTEELLRGLVGDMLKLMQTHRGQVRTVFEHHRELTAAQRIEVNGKRERYRQFVEDSVSAGVDSGSFRDVNARLATLAIVGAVNWSYQWYVKDGELTTDEIAEEFVDLFLNGLRVREPTHADRGAE